MKKRNVKKSYNRILEISEDAQQITLPDSRYYRRNGKYYPSAKVASEIEKVPYPTLTGRIRKSSPKWSEWRLATEEEKLQYNACAL